MAEVLENEITRLKDIMGLMEDFCHNTKNLPYELFLSMVAMIVEYRCAAEGKDIFKEIDNLSSVMKQVNNVCGTTTWHLEESQ